MDRKIKLLLVLVVVAVVCVALIVVFAFPLGQSFTRDSFKQQADDEYVYVVTFSTNPDLNIPLKQSILYPSATAVGDEIRIQIQKANTTLLSTKNYDTLYGRLQNSSVSSSTWDSVTSDSTLLAAYNPTAGCLISEGSPFIVPRNFTAANATIFQMLTTYWNFTSAQSEMGPDYFKWEGYNGFWGGSFNQTKLSLKFALEGYLLYWRIYNGTESGWSLIYSLEMIPELKALIPQADDEFIWNVTVSENPSVNPIAPNVGNEIKIQILINNWTLIAPSVWQTLYGVVYTRLDINHTWVLITENISLLAGYSVADGILITDWNPYFITADMDGILGFLQAILPYPMYTGWGSSSYRDAYGYTGSSWQAGDLNAIKTLFHFSSDGSLINWLFYNGTGSGWDLIYSLEREWVLEVPGYNFDYILLGMVTGVVLYLIANRGYRKVTLDL
jgi:hypothetical protein